MIVREFQFFDVDGNGQVTLEEYQSPMAGMVARRDRNGDGALNQDDHGRRGKGEGMGHRRGDGPDDDGQEQSGDGSNP
jgi:hypothetical protein